jgi:hypothetical protein
MSAVVFAPGLWSKSYAQLCVARRIDLVQNDKARRNQVSAGFIRLVVEYG